VPASGVDVGRVGRRFLAKAQTTPRRRDAKKRGLDVSGRCQISLVEAVSKAELDSIVDGLNGEKNVAKIL
jgi:hypothetical protein